MRSSASRQFAVTAAVLICGGMILLLYKQNSLYEYMSKDETSILQTILKSPEPETAWQNGLIGQSSTRIHKLFDYKAEMQKLNDAKVNQDDPRLIKLIRDYYIIPPSTLPLKVKQNKSDYSMGQAAFVDKNLNHMEHGFYIECGALDGETRSNTLFFEKVRKWNGLLIDGDPSNVEKIVKMHRKAFVIHACLNTQPYPSKRTFNAAFNMGRIADTAEVADWIKKNHLKQKPVEVQCFPLYSILLAINQLKIDYFSLDVEGDELSVLKTIPWDKLDIGIVSAEHEHVPEGPEGLKKYALANGYDVMPFRGPPKDVIIRKKRLR